MKSIREKKKSIREEEFPGMVAYTISKVDIIDRIEQLENKVYKNNRLEVSLAQKILLLKHSGILEPITKLFIKEKDRVSFLSFLLDGDKDTIEKYLRAINLPESKLEISRNYEKLVTMFQEIGLKEQESFCEKRLDELLKLKELPRKR